MKKFVKRFLQVLAGIVLLTVALTACSAEKTAVESVDAGEKGKTGLQTIVSTTQNAVKQKELPQNQTKEKPKALVSLENTVILHIDSSKALVNGNETDLVPEKPAFMSYLKEEVTYVPLDFIKQNFDITGTFNAKNGKLRLQKNGKEIITLLSSDLDMAPYDDEQRNCSLPLRKVVEKIGKKIDYEDGLIVISDRIDFFDPVEHREQIKDIKKKLTGIQSIGNGKRLENLLHSQELLSGVNWANYGIMENGIMLDEAVSISAPAPTTSAAPQMEKDTPQMKNAAAGAMNSAADMGIERSEKQEMREEADEYSSTNTQVQGVDEADVVKTDGKYIYQVNRDRILIVESYPPNNMKVIYTLEFDQKVGFYPLEMYIDADTLVVIGDSARSARQHVTDTVKMFVYDMADRANLKLVRETEVEGYYKTSRKIGSSVYIVTNQDFYSIRPYWHGGLSKENVEDITEQSASGGESEKTGTGYQIYYQDSEDTKTEFVAVGYDRMFYFPGCFQPNYMTVAGIDIDDLNKPVSLQVIIDSGENVYASEDYLYVATGNYWGGHWLSNESGTTTAVHRFKLEDGNVIYIDRGEVKGEILNQFSMDQNGQYFRIATTSYDYSKDFSFISNNNLYVLDAEMNVVGKLEKLAPGENIYSVRFMGDRAYVVTFKTVDPLFVIDLKEPNNPHVLGALKIPGYSDYLHPYDENHIIGFGKDTVEYTNTWGGMQNTTAYYQGMKIAIFDVSDVTNPKEKFKINIGDRGTDSELLYNHKALLFSKERELLAFPVTVMTVPESQKTGNLKEDSLQYGQFEFQGAYVYRINLTEGFTQIGRITHISAEEYRKSGSYWYADESNVDRILYIKDALYTLSQKYIFANDLSASLKEIGCVELP